MTDQTVCAARSLCPVTYRCNTGRNCSASHVEIRAVRKTESLFVFGLKKTERNHTEFRVPRSVGFP